MKRLVTAALSIAFLAAAWSSPAVAAPSDPVPEPAPPPATDPEPSGPAVYGLIGKTEDGQTFTYIWLADEPAPAASEASISAASAFCYYRVSDITYTDRFRWSTWHSCSGT